MVLLTRRRLARQLARLTGAAGASAADAGAAPEVLLHRLETRLRQLGEEQQRLRRRTAVLETAIESLPLGLQLLSAGGSELLRNPGFPDPASPEGVLVRESIERLVARTQVPGAPPAASELVLHAGSPRRDYEVLVRNLAPHAAQADEPASGAGSATPAGGASSVVATDDAGTEGDSARRRGFIAVVTDVTERQRAEAVRRDFIANAGHELRTPVGALSVLVEMLADEHDDATARRLFSRVERETRRLAEMIDDLLSLSRLESGARPEPEAVDLGALLRALVERTESAAALRDVAVVIDVAEDAVGPDSVGPDSVGPDSVGPDSVGQRAAVADLRQAAAADAGEVLGVARELMSALINLVENAVKYSPAGGTVRITTAPGTLATGASAVVVSVADDGPGIAPEDRERIFERFYRVDRARSRDTGGSGIGLAIVKHVAQLHGGEVRLRSVEGRGSTFGLVLPVHPPGPPAASST